MQCKIKEFKVLELPTKGEPNSRYYVLNPDDTVFEYITDKDGNYKQVVDGMGGGSGVTSTTVTSAALVAIDNELSALSIRVNNNSAQVTSINNALKQGISVLSQQLSALSQVVSTKNTKITIQDEGINIVSNPSLINFTGNAVSAFLSGGVVKIDISTTGGAGSVTSANHLSLANALSALSSIVSSNSAQVTSIASNLSIAVNIVSNNLSAEISARQTASAALETHINTVSGAQATTSARVTSVLSAVSTKNQIITLKNQGSAITVDPANIDFFGNAISAYMSAGVVKINISTAVVSGTGQSVTSAQHTSLVNRVSALSSQVTSADNANSAAINTVSNALSTEIVNRIAGDNALSTLISVLSAQLSLQISAISTVLSNLNSAIIANSVQVTSADGALSIRINTVSNNLSQNSVVLSNLFSAVVANSALLSTVASALSARIDLVSNALSALVLNSLADVSTDGVTNGQILIYNSAEGQWIASTLAVGSVTSTELSAAVAAEMSNRISADNVLSNLISALSVQLSLQISALSQAHSALSANVVGISLNLSALSTRVDSISNNLSQNSVVLSNLASAVVANSAFMSNLQSAIQANSADVTSVKDRISANSALLSNALSAIAANSAQMLSADNAISNAVSILSVQLSLQVSALSQVISALSANVAGISTNVSAISTRLSALSAQVTSVNNRISGISATVSSNSAQMTSADNAISNAVSIVSVAQATTSAAVTSVNQVVSVISQQVSALSARVAGISADLTSFKVSLNNFGDVSISSPTDGQVLMYNTSAGQWFNSTIPTGSGSVTSQELSAAIAVETSNRISADNALSTLISALSAALSTTASALSQQISILSVVVSNQGSAIQANSADFTSFKASLNNFGDVSIASPADQQILVYNSAAGQWVNSTINATASVTSQELSAAVAAEASNRISADNALSNLISALSVQLSLQISAISQAHSALSNQNSIDHVSINTRIDTNSAELTSVKSALSSLSATVASVQSALSALSQANSADHVSIRNLISIVSNATSVVSAAQAVTSAELTSVKSALSALSQANSADHASIRNLISIVSAAQAVTSAELTSVKSAISALSATVLSVQSALSALSQANSVDHVSIRNLISIVSNAVSVVSVAASNALSVANAASNAASIVSVAQAATSAELTSVRSALSALSQANSAAHASIMAAVSTKNPTIMVLSNDVSVLSSPTSFNFTGAGVQVSVSGTKAIISIGGGGGGSVTSQELSLAVGVETSNRISADNALSNIISALASVVSTHTSALSALSLELAGYPLDGPDFMRRQGNVIGDIYVASAFTSTGDFVFDLAGRTVSVSGGNALITGSTISVSAGAFMPGPVVYLPEWTNLDILTIEMTFSFPNSNSSANNEYGVTMGVFGGINGYSIDGWMYGAFDGNLGGLRIRYGDHNLGNTLVDGLGVAVVPNIGVDDIIHYKLELYENKVVFSARNVTDDSAWVTIQGMLTGTQTKHGTSHIGFSPGVTNMRLHSFKVNSKQIENPDIYLYGDSKFTKGTTQAESLPALLKNNYGVVVANSGTGDSTQKLIDALSEVKNRVRPKKALIAVSNDLRFAVATSVWQNNLSIIYADLTSAGVEVYFTAFQEGPTGANQSAMDAHLLSAYPTKYIRRAYLDTASCEGCLLSDDIHMAAFGNKTIYEAIVLDGKLDAPVSPYVRTDTISSDSYTLSAGDHNKIKYFTNSTSAIFVNIPKGLPIGFDTVIFRGEDARSVTISAETSVIFEAQGTVLQDEKTAANIIHKLSDYYIGVGAFLAVSGGTGTASVTSASHLSVVNRLSALSAQVTSADDAISAVAADALSKANTVSNAVSALSNQNSIDHVSINNRISAISTDLTSVEAQIVSINDRISGNSANITSVANIVSGIAAGLGTVQMKVVAGAQSVTATALTKISGLSLSVAAGGIYQIDGLIIYGQSGTSSHGFGVSIETGTVSVARLKWDGNLSIGIVPLSSQVSTGTESWRAGHLNQAGFGSVTYSATGGVSANVNVGVELAGVVVIGNAGTIQLKAKNANNAAGVLTVRAGSYVRAYRIG